MNSTVCILKPDHLGDLVLSKPAISFTLENYPNAELFVSPQSYGLASFLFPKAKLDCVSFSHLSKINEQNFSSNLNDRKFDLLISLRKDHALNEAYFAALAQSFFFTENDNNKHETKIQKEAIFPVVGYYSSNKYFFDLYEERPIVLAQNKVGICLSAGHFRNSIDLSFWRDLNGKLVKQGIETFLVAGPSELKILSVAKSLLNVPDSNIILGSSDFGAFLKSVSTLDFIISGDAGTAHIASLACPIISIFGASPFRRYRPYGKENKVVSLELNCSPCSQFSKFEVNSCFSKECLSSITADLFFNLLISILKGEKKFGIH